MADYQLIGNYLENSFKDIDNARAFYKQNLKSFIKDRDEAGFLKGLYHLVKAQGGLKVYERLIHHPKHISSLEEHLLNRCGCDTVTIIGVMVALEERLGIRE